MDFLAPIKGKLHQYCHLASSYVTKSNINLQEPCQFLYQYKYAFIWGIFGLIVINIVFILLKSDKIKIKKFEATLINIKEISHDTKIFTYDLPSDMKSLYLRVGEHIQLQASIDGKLVQRKYTPISRSDIIRNSFQLLIKIYYKNTQFPEGGVMTQYLDKMKIGDKITVTKPYGRFNYLTASEIQVKETNGTVNKCKVDDIFMVGGGTGITPLYQIIQYATEEENNGIRPNITLLFANRTEDDILIKSELEAFQKQNSKFKCFFSIDHSIKEGWKGMTGFVNEEKIKATLPKNLEKAFFVVCGPPILCNIVQKILLTTYKIRPNQFFRF